MRAKIFDKGEKTEIVLEAESEKEEKQIEGIWAKREEITLASVCRIQEPSPPGIFLSLKRKK